MTVDPSQAAHHLHLVWLAFSSSSVCGAVKQVRPTGRTFCPCALLPQGTRILTASNDQTCRLWDAETGECLQVLAGHTDEVFSCTFNYAGTSIITGSKDNTCRIWGASADRRDSQLSDC